MAKLTPAIKQDIVKKYKEGVKVSIIAQCYDVDHQAIRYVLKNYEKFGEESLAVKRVGRRKLAEMSPEAQKLYHLRKENERLKMENIIWKQLSALFGPKNNKK